MFDREDENNKKIITIFMFRKYFQFQMFGLVKIVGQTENIF